MHTTAKSGVYLHSVQPLCTVHLEAQLSVLYQWFTHPEGTDSDRLPVMCTSLHCTHSSCVHSLEVQLLVLYTSQ